jgi:hypothetical protein
MERVQEIYQETVSHLSSDDQLQLALVILQEVAKRKAPFNGTPKRKPMIELLAEWEAQRLFKTSAEADAYLREERDSWDR